jgi:hypothetical protein
VSSAFLFLDPGWEKSGSGIESLETLFGAKILKFFYADPDPGPWIRNLFNPGSGIRDPG